MPSWGTENDRHDETRHRSHEADGSRPMKNRSKPVRRRLVTPTASTADYVTNQKSRPARLSENFVCFVKRKITLLPNVDRETTQYVSWKKQKAIFGP